MNIGRITVLGGRMVIGRIKERLTTILNSHLDLMRECDDEILKARESKEAALEAGDGQVVNDCNKEIYGQGLKRSTHSSVTIDIGRLIEEIGETNGMS